MGRGAFHLVIFHWHQKLDQGGYNGINVGTGRHKMGPNESWSWCQFLTRHGVFGLWYVQYKRLWVDISQLKQNGWIQMWRGFSVRFWISLHEYAASKTFSWAIAYLHTMFVLIFHEIGKYLNQENCMWVKFAKLYISLIARMSCHNCATFCGIPRVENEPGGKNYKLPFTWKGRKGTFACFCIERIGQKGKKELSLLQDRQLDELPQHIFFRGKKPWTFVFVSQHFLLILLSVSFVSFYFRAAMSMQK